MFFLWSGHLPWCGDWTPASVPSLAEGKSSPSNASVFPPSSFILLSFVWFYIFFSGGQVLLFALSWCSACTSVSEGVFLMYLWGKMCSMSTYFSAILFSSALYFWLIVPVIHASRSRETANKQANFTPGAIGKEEQKTLNASRRTEIIKIRAEIKRNEGDYSKDQWNKVGSLRR